MGCHVPLAQLLCGRRYTTTLRPHESTREIWRQEQDNDITRKRSAYSRMRVFLKDKRPGFFNKDALTAVSVAFCLQISTQETLTPLIDR
jgi:hypothetical protein